MSSVCVLTPIVVGSWPAIASAALGAAAALGFTVSSAESARAHAPRTVEMEVPNSEVVAEGLAGSQTLRIERDGVVIEIGVDDRGKCTVCASGEGTSKADLKRIGEEVAGRIVQQFAYHKLVTELKSRGYTVAEESVQQDQSIQLRVRLGS